jgi:hypothetical protein
MKGKTVEQNLYGIAALNKEKKTDDLAFVTYIRPSAF